MDSQITQLQDTNVLRKTPHVLVFASGTSGVGKSSLVANLAAAMAARGLGVCIIDADTGLSNINSVLGLRPAFNLEQLARGERSLAEAVIKTSDGVAVLPGAQTLMSKPLAAEQHSQLERVVRELEGQYDYFLIDVPAALTDKVLQLIEAARYAFLLVSADPAALTDGFSLLKALNARNYRGSLRVVVNQALDYPAATETYRRFAAVAEKCLKQKVEYGGFVVRDDNVSKAVALQMTVIDLAAGSPASRCLFSLADNIVKHIGSDPNAPGLTDYWLRMLTAADAAPTAEPAVTAGYAEPGPDIRSAVRTQTPAVASDAPQRLLADIRRQVLDQPALERFTGDFVEAYCEQFGTFPAAFKALFYRWLETENYAAPRLLELASTLEALYAMRHQTPMYKLSEAVARLAAQVQGQPEQHQDAIEQLRAAFRQAYHRDAFDAEQAVLASVGSDEFTEQRFEELLQKLRDAFHARFNRPYQSQPELLLNSTLEALDTMAVDQQNLQDEIAMLMHGFQLLASRREKLSIAIKTLLNPGLGGVARP
ncbi:AAA family ATPase [Methylomonas sp. HW2-6]|uniref:nucleotide-binding protein n=1 Tax=Methylomonas sp. HW2-6 TaxID=3376687 RepID=UPI0040433A6D